MRNVTKAVMIASAIPLSVYVCSAAWHLAYSNSQDGWKGPVAAIEISDDDSQTVRSVPLAYQAFNTNKAGEIYGTLTYGTLTNVGVVSSYMVESFATNAFFKTNAFVVLMSDELKVTFPVRDQDRTNIINSIVASGDFCRVRGHVFSTHQHVTLEYVPGKLSCRECAACGKHETMFAEWK